jgi:hypothetical protein
MGDAQVDHVMPFAVGAPTACLPAAHRTLHQAAAQDLIERRQLGKQPPATLD